MTIDLFEKGFGNAKKVDYLDLVVGSRVSLITLGYSQWDYSRVLNLLRFWKLWSVFNLLVTLLGHFGGWELFLEILGERGALF